MIGADTIPVHVVFKKFAIDVDNYSLEELNNITGSLRGDKNRAEDISNGYVYFFYYPQAAVTGRTILHEAHEITGPRQEISVPQVTDGRLNLVHYAYSKIELSDERIGHIKEDIKNRGTLSTRAVHIPTQGFVLPRGSLRENSYIGITQTDNTVRKEVYLYDWHGYLERCANDYYGTVDGNFNGYSEFLEQNVDLKGNGLEGSGVSLGGLYALADSVDTLIQEDRRYREVLASDSGGTLHELFYADTREKINNERGGELVTKTIRLISLLMRDRRANSTFLDYMYGTPDQIWRLIKLISECLYKFQEILHKEEKRELFRIWQRPNLHIDVERNNNLLRHLHIHGFELLGSRVHEFIGQASVFLYIAIAARIRNDEDRQQLEDILGIWLSADISNEDRLIINGLLTGGVFRRPPFSQGQDAFSFSDSDESRGRLLGNRRRGNLSDAKNAIAVFNVIANTGMVQMPTIIPSALGRIETAIELHNLLTRIALAAQVRDLTSAVPHFISILEPAVALAAKKSGRWAGLGAASFLLAVRSFATVIRQPMRVGGIGGAHLAISGASFLYAGKFFLIPKGWPVGLFLLGIGYLSRFLGEQRLHSRMRQIVEYSIWGTRKELVRNDTFPPWWPWLENSQYIDEELTQEILVSNRRIEATNLMQLNIASSIAETFRRNEYMMGLAAQVPNPIPSFSAGQRLDPLLGGYNYTGQLLLVAEGLQDLPLIESVMVRLAVSSSQEPHEKTYPQHLLGDITQGERISIVFFGNDLREESSRAYQEIKGNTRYIEVPRNDIHAAERAEVIVQYKIPDLLPVRFEHIFRGNPRRM